MILSAFLSVLASPAPRLSDDWNVRNDIPFEKSIFRSHLEAGVLSRKNSVDAFEAACRPGHAGQRVTWLKDMCEILNRNAMLRLYMDLKSVNLEHLAAVARSAGVAGRSIISSTEYTIIRTWMQLTSGSKMLHWLGVSEATLSERLTVLRTTGIQAIDKLRIHLRPEGADGVTPSPKFLAKTGEELWSYGLLFQVLPWKSADPAAFVRLLELGAASFPTGYPDIAAATVRRFYQSGVRSK